MFKKIYAQNYDRIYADKNYRVEADFYYALIKKYGQKNTSRILSIGCGTLNHEQHLVKRGFIIDGIECSAEMILLARKKIKKEKIKNIAVFGGDMRDFIRPRQYDAALSMFNVVSYCKNLNELEKVICSVGRALKSNGIFIFDCWNAEAVLKHSPRREWSCHKNGSSELYRLVEPTQPSLNGSFNLAIELIQIKNSRVIARIKEVHGVNGWKLADISRILRKNGLILFKSGQFMNFKKPVSDDVWSMVIVAKKL